MIIAISGFKGGVAKTTTALHLAGFLSTRGSTLLVDADPNRSALRFSSAGPGLPYPVMSQNAAMKHIASFQHIIFDTPGNPDEDDLLDIARGVDLMVLPTLPDRMSFDPLIQLEPKLRGAAYRVLVTLAPTPPERDGEGVRDSLAEAGLPVFKTVIHRRAGFKHAANGGYLMQPGEYDAFSEEVLELVPQR